MSWLSRVSDALERSEEDSMSSSVLDAVVASRGKSVSKLEAECAEYSRECDALPIGPARDALRAVLNVKEQRLKRLRGELAALLEAAVDPRQGELPGARKK